MITTIIDDNTKINTIQVAISHSSVLVLGRNVSSKCDIVQTGENYLRINQITIPIQDVEFQLYIPSSIFIANVEGDRTNFLSTFLHYWMSTQDQNRATVVWNK